MTEQARKAKAAYMREYRKTERGAEKIRQAQERYWERKYAAMCQDSAGKERHYEQVH